MTPPYGSQISVEPSGASILAGYRKLVTVPQPKGANASIRIMVGIRIEKRVYRKLELLSNAEEQHRARKVAGQVAGNFSFQNLM